MEFNQNPNELIVGPESSLFNKTKKTNSVHPDITFIPIKPIIVRH